MRNPKTRANGTWTEAHHTMMRDAIVSFFNYNPDTGVFTRKVDIVRSNGRRTNYLAGSVAGSRIPNGYRILQFHVDGVRHIVTEHRAAFYAMGFAPPPMVDHINGKRDDNRWCNLRDSNPSLNQLNKHKKVGKDTDLPVGIYRVKRKGRSGVWFCVKAQVGEKRLSSFFRSLESAVSSRNRFISSYVNFENASHR